jgi:outer membrane lipoprotein SlyB
MENGCFYGGLGNQILLPYRQLYYMNTYADKTREENSRAVANHVPSRQGGVKVAVRSPTIQMTEDGRWWGTVIGGGLGAVAGAAAGYTYGALSATAGAITGGVADAVKGYQHGGVKSALTWGLTGAASNAAFGYSSGALHGASVGMKLGSAVGSGIGDWWTGADPTKKEEADNIARLMKIHLNELQSLDINPVAIHPVLAGTDPEHPGPKSPLKGQLDDNETKLLNWMYRSLGMNHFNEVAKGGQVRVSFDAAVFNGLKGLGAQQRQSSHYSGILFPSGFTQVVGEQYGTKGVYLPTVLFGKITDRKGDEFMYFQPEGHAFNPDTGWKERLHHVKDAYNYAVHGVQQGPHGTSLHTDADPITGSGKKYQPTFSDKYGYARAIDFESFAANLLYTSGGSALLSKAGVTSNEAKAAAMHLLTAAGYYATAYAVWKKFNV